MKFRNVVNVCYFFNDNDMRTRNKKELTEYHTFFS